MADNLTIDGDALGSVSQFISSEAGQVPQQKGIDLGGCGSPSVLGAVESFNLWVAMASALAQDTGFESATDLSTIARTFGEWDESAANAGQMTPSGLRMM